LQYITTTTRHNAKIVEEKALTTIRVLDISDNNKDK